MTGRKHLRRSTIIVGTLIVVLLLVGGVVWWFQGEILRIRGELVAATAAQQRRLALNTQQASLENDLARRADALARISRLVPAPADLDAVLSAVERVAKEAGVAVVATALEAVPDASAAAPAATGAFRLVPFAVSASGDPVGLVRFLQAMEYLPYLTSVSGFSLQAVPAARAVPAGPLEPGGSPPGFQPAGVETVVGELSLTLLVAVRESAE